MRFLRELFEGIRESYADGVEMINESWAQIAHVTSIISVLIFLWATSPRIGMFWFWLFAIYMCLLGVCGFLKFDTFEDDYKYTCIYAAGTVLLIVVGGIATGVIKTVSIVGFVAVVTKVLWMAGDALVAVTLTVDGKKPFFEKLYNKNPKVFILTYIAILILLIWIPVMMLNVNVFLKILIMAGYMFMIPIIARLADEGIDIECIFD